MTRCSCVQQNARCVTRGDTQNTRVYVQQVADCCEHGGALLGSLQEEGNYAVCATTELDRQTDRQTEVSTVARVLKTASDLSRIIVNTLTTKHHLNGI